MTAIIQSQSEYKIESYNSINEAFENIWQHYPRKEGKILALKGFRKYLQEGCSKEEMLSAVLNYKKLYEEEGRERRYIMQGSTFFGPNARWKDFVVIELPPIRAPTKRRMGFEEKMESLRRFAGEEQVE